MLKISGKFRVQSIYQGDSQAYLTLKDKTDGGSIVKVAFDLPLDKNIVDDGLIELDGQLAPRVYNNNVSLSFVAGGKIVAIPEK